MALQIQMKDVGGWVKGPTQQYPQSVYRDCPLAKVEQNDKGNFKLSFNIGKGPFSGNQITLTFGADEKQGNHASWITFLVAAKAAKDRDAAAKLLAKGIDVEKLVGKVKCAIMCLDPADGEKYGERQCVPPEHVESLGERYGFDGEDAGGEAVETKSNGKSNNGKSNGKQAAEPAAEAAGDDEDPLGLSN